MIGEYEKVSEAAAFVKSRIPAEPQVLLVLGSGLGDFADTLESRTVVRYAEIPHFAQSTVVGHAGEFVFGEKFGVRVLAMKGRVHAYEGNSPAQVVFPLRTAWKLGARSLLVTNAAGGLNGSFRVGDLMVIRDHINLSGYNPLVGHNDERFGPRFPDMSTAYTPGLRTLAHDVASSRNQTLREGVYIGVSGPSYETPAEIRMFASLGADAVGMSTVTEVIAARHLGMSVLGISCITNLAAGLGHDALDHSEVQDTANRVRGQFTGLLDGVLAQWNKIGSGNK